MHHEEITTVWYLRRDLMNQTPQNRRWWAVCAPLWQPTRDGRAITPSTAMSVRERPPLILDGDVLGEVHFVGVMRRSPASVDRVGPVIDWVVAAGSAITEYASRVLSARRPELSMGDATWTLDEDTGFMSLLSATIAALVASTSPAWSNAIVAFRGDPPSWRIRPIGAPR